MRAAILRTTLADCVVWARLIVRTCEDMGFNAGPATLALVDITELAQSPTLTGRVWTRCGEPALRGYAAQAVRMRRPDLARAYEAIIAVRLLAAESDP